MATTPQTTAPVEPMRIILRDVPWSVYKALRGIETNDHIRMAYLNGVLELMSPELKHERDGKRLEQVVYVVSRLFGLTFENAGMTTLRRKGRKPGRGAGREPDVSFYFGENARRMAAREAIDLSTDPPPDLAIEVDNTADSRAKLPIYARLMVPEVWYDDVNARTLWFGRLQDDGTYCSVESSGVLPMLDRSWVRDVLNRGEGMLASEFALALESWVRDELRPPRAEAVRPTANN